MIDYKRDIEGEIYREREAYFVGKYIVQAIEWPSFNKTDIALYDTAKSKKSGLIYQSSIDMTLVEAYGHGIKVALVLSVIPDFLIKHIDLDVIDNF